MDTTTIASGVFWALIIGGAVGLILGVFFGFNVSTASMRRELRDKLQQTKYDPKSTTYFVELYKSRKDLVDNPLIDVKAAVLDSFGVDFENDELRFTAKLLEISKQGAVMLSPTFLPIGYDILVSCKDKQHPFQHKEAKVQSVVLVERGLVIGIEFMGDIAEAKTTIPV
ncbi:MAG: hypothetical protein ABH885_06645 [Candidatus Omnitrophota bacterium]